MAHSGKTMTFATDLVPQEDSVYNLGQDNLKWIIRGSLPLSDITGADDLKAIEALTGTSGLLKKTAANTWTLDTNKYVTSSGVTKVSTGAGLTGGDITTTGTVKANLTSETKFTNAAVDGTETSGRVYPVRLDKNGKLAVNVPWTNVNSNYLPLTGGNMTGNINRYYSTSSTEPMLKLSAYNVNAYLFQIGHGGSAGSITGNYYILKYMGAQSSPNNELQLISAVSTSTEKIAIKINEDGVISFPQMNKGSSTKPVYFNAGVFTEGTTYAGGTAVTLNGSSAAGSTAAFYAPTAVGSEGQVLKSQGTGAPVWEEEYKIEIVRLA